MYQLDISVILSIPSTYNPQGNTSL